MKIDAMRNVNLNNSQNPWNLSYSVKLESNYVPALKNTVNLEINDIYVLKKGGILKYLLLSHKFQKCHHLGITLYQLMSI